MYGNWRNFIYTNVDGFIPLLNPVKHIALISPHSVLDYGSSNVIALVLNLFTVMVSSDRAIRVLERWKIKMWNYN